ncbi:MAG: hypothetical protein OXP10_04485 [Chloroflexota bacterium]|nr:hypothetical protein [Chloroflexota bacterium]
MNSRSLSTALPRTILFAGIMLAVGLLAFVLYGYGSTFAQDSGAIEHAENDKGPVATFTAEDPEGVTPVTWSIAADGATLPDGFTEATDNADENHFDISKDGVLTFDIGGDGSPDASVAPDFEAPRAAAFDSANNNNTYRVVVAASDAATGGNVGYHKVTVKVTDEAEAGEITVTLSGSASAATAMQFRFGTVLTAVVEDGDVSGTTKTVSSPILRWYRGGTEINGETSLEYTTTAEDVGKRIRLVATYYVGSNTNQETASWTSDYPVLATRVGANKLKFDPGTLERTVAEGDKDANVGAPVRATGNHGVVTYSLPALSDNANFDIDKKTGQITTDGALNYEGDGLAGANCTVQNRCVVRVRATDATSATAETASTGIFADATVNIRITDVNEEPMFPEETDDPGFDNAQGMKAISSPENATALYATDRDGDGELTTVAAVTYKATDPEELNVTYRLMGPDGARFQLKDAADVTHGEVLSFRAKPDYENPGDANRDNVYEVTIRASDGTLNEDRMVKVTVTAVDDAPVITGGSTFNFAENGKGSVATFTARDPEGVTPIIWSVPTDLDASAIDAIEDADDADNNHFDISKDGVLTFDIGGDDDTGDASVAPDFEAPRGTGAADANNTNTYKVVVVASDAETGGVMGYHKVTVKVTNVAETGEITVTLSGSASAATAMQFRFGTVLTAVVEDGDVSGTTKTVSSPILRWYRGGTEINGETSLEYTTTAEDVGKRIRLVATYYVGSNTNQETASWTSDYPVLATRVGANKLKFDPGTLERTVAEGDKDANVGAPVRATGNHGVVTYSLPALSDNANFDIDKKTGQITTDGALNYEGDGLAGANCTVQNRCVVRVRATDATSATAETASTGIFADATVNIRITDVNEEPMFPEETDDPGFDNAQGMKAISSPENATALYATDRDGDGELTTEVAVTYAAEDPEGISVNLTLMGPDGGKFQLSGAGVLSFMAKPDYENPGDANRNNVYEVTVRASDGTLNTDRKVKVTVTNLDEPPVIMIEPASGLRISGDSRVNVAEGTTAVDTYTASDPDSASVRWTLSGADSGSFTINSTGALSFRSAPDYETPGSAAGTNTYSVTVMGTDSQSNSDDIAVTVTVTDVDETVTPPPATIVDRFDPNRDGIVEMEDMRLAVGDYFGASPTITEADMRTLVGHYFSQ